MTDRCNSQPASQHQWLGTPKRCSPAPPAVPIRLSYPFPPARPNPFRTGRTPTKAAVAVTEGLLLTLPREQVRGVLAHEMAHIANRDILVTTIAAMIGAAIAAIANILQFSMFFGGGDDDDSPLGFVGLIATIILAPIAAMIIQMAISRQREYQADATGAELDRDGLLPAGCLA